MGRFVQWVRLLGWWFAARHALWVRVVRLEQALAVERDAHYGQMADAAERYARDVGLLREDIAAFRVECERREQAQTETEKRVQVERVKGNEGWQEAGVQRRRADGLQAELDLLAGAEVEHVAVGD